MFISFEGTEGVGKSTLISKLYSTLSEHHDVILTREPGGTPLAEKIRGLLLTPDDEKMSVSAELLLIYAARAQHIQHVITPALEAHKIVLCDRFIDASMAYQHGGRGMPKEHIELLNQTFVSDLPQITFWLDAPVEVGMQRAKNRGALDRFEQEKLEFFSRVRACYQDLAQSQPTRIYRLDATQTADQIFEQAYAIIASKLSS